MSSDDDLDDGLIVATQLSVQPPTTHISASFVPAMSSTNEIQKNTRFDMNWVNAHHQMILEDVRTKGVDACRWGVILERWREFLSDAPFEEVEFGCIRAILQNARLASIPQPTSYETLRKLGKDVLETDADNEAVRRNLLDRLLTPGNSDSELYGQYFGLRDKSNKWYEERFLMNHLDRLHTLNGSILSQELNKERILGFVVPHIRSNRYHPVELGAILKHLVRDIDIEIAQKWIVLADQLQEGSQPAPEYISEAQAFILRCFENIYRARQSLEGAEKRNSAVGVILFGDISSNAEHRDISPSTLDVWFDEEVERASLVSADRTAQLERFTLKQIRQLIYSEQEQWKFWEPKLRLRKGREFKVAQQPLFDLLGPTTLSSHSLLSNVVNSIKSYCEKKRNLRDLALKSTRKHCVAQAILDSGSDSQQAAAVAPQGGRSIAVFGYCLNSDLKGVPESAEQSVIVRSVPLKRKHVGDEAGASEELDTRVFEIGVSLAGNYLAFCPGDADELHDMLKTSGLGLGKEDRLHFLMFVPQGQHSPRSKPVEDLLSRKDAGGNFTHVLLTIPDAPTRPIYADIADAGGRFLIDLRRMGSVRTEAMRYQPLAVEPTASVAVGEDGKARAFRRLAVLLPPSLPNEMPHGYQQGRLGMEVEGQNAGFKESAEIIAEVLSLVAIDKSKVDDGTDSARYRGVIKAHLEGNPLLLYYTSLDLLNAVDPAFAQILAEYWEEKLGLGVNALAAKLGRDEQECRRLVFCLITSGIPRSASGFAEAARLQSRSPAPLAGAERTPRTPARPDVAAPGGAAAAAGVAAGKRIALASERHLQLLPGIIQRETHFAREEIYVEETNFESVLLRLKRAAPTALTFVFVYITGRISADQINQFVSVPASTIRLIFRYSQSLVSLLDLTPSIRDSIHRPESITDALLGKMQVVAYSAQSAVGAMVTHNTELIARNPTVICGRGPFWDNLYPEALARRAAAWREEIEEWVYSPVDSDAGPAEFLRIIVAPDHAITAKQLEGCFQSRMLVQTVDAGERADFDKLKSFVDNRSAPSFSYSRIRSPVPRPPRDGAEEGGEQFAAEVFILCRATFLPHSRLEVLVSRCCARRTKLVLLATEATSSISRFRVFKDPGSPPVWVRVPILMQRLSREFPSGRLQLAFTGLQLLFSQEAVVSDNHFSSLKNFLDGSELSSLDFLDHIEGIPNDLSVRAAFILALANTEESAVVAPETLLRKATLAEIMCMHINRYLRYFIPRKNDTPFLSFLEFCSQPRTRFLSQIHRIEAYICYIFSHTEQRKRLCANASSELPLGFPLTVSFLDVSKNVHCSSNPGSLLSNVFYYDDDSFPLDGKVPVAQYIDPGRGDVVTHMHEIAEHRAITGAELHWEEMFTKWESGPEIVDDVLDHILIHSPSRISMLLCMTPPQIVNLGLSVQALRAVSNDFENCQESLRQLDESQYRTLRTRTAAIWWLLLTKGENLEQPSEDTFAKDQSLLLDSGIYIEPKASPNESGAAEKNQLLIRVASAMLPLDRSDTLTSQHAVRDFLLSNCNEAVVAGILNKESIRIGQAFVNACVARETLNKILNGEIGAAVFGIMGNTFKWIKDSSAANEDSMRSEVQRLALRLTPHAVSCLLLSANPPADMYKARNGILEPCLSTTEQEKGADAAKNFLDALLKPLCTNSNRGFTVKLFEILAQPANDGQFRFPLPDLKDVPDTWNAVFKTMLDSSHAAAMLQSARDQNFLLPFEESPKLCAIYVEHFCQDGRNATNDIDEHIVLLKTDLAREAIYKYLSGPNSRLDTESAITNLSMLGLLWFTWWSMPSASFALRFLPVPATWPLFQSVAKKVYLTSNTEKIQRGMSTIARLAFSPHTLPASMVNALKCYMIDGKPVINSKKYVLAQLGSTMYPVYGFRSHVRHLPRACVEMLIKDMHNRPLPGFIRRDEQEKIKALFPVTDSGVSIDTVQHNLNILVHIQDSPESVEQDKTAEMRAQIFLPTFAWFLSAGIKLADLKAMCNEDHQKKLGGNHAAMLSVWRTPDFPRSLVYCPLPVYCDVRYVSGKTNALFQFNDESANNTIQWLSMLGIQYKLQDLNAAEEFRMYAANRKAGKAVDPDLPKTIVRNLMTEIAKEIARRHSHVSVGANSVGKYHVVLVLDESGSMGGEPWSSLTAAVKDFLSVRLLAGAEDIVTIIPFNSSARVACEMEPIESCERKINDLLSKMMGGNTLFSPALSKARGILQTGISRHVDHVPFLLFMSDGGSGDGDADMQASCLHHPLPIYRFGFEKMETMQNSSWEQLHKCDMPIFCCT
jgi:hypothetical protein